MIYFDFNATSPLHEAVLEAMVPYYRNFYGNPSSLHRIGRISRDAVEAARIQVAGLASASASQVVFTSGGTEANSLAICGLADVLPPGQILVSPIEHSSVLEPLKALSETGWTVRFMELTDGGRVCERFLESAIDPETRFAVCMIANNETGVIQDIQRIAEQFRDLGIPLHCDGVQAFGKIAIDFSASRFSFMSVSAHKIGGPKGVGALVFDKSVRLEPLLKGGGQEKGLRGGTENVAGIVGFGVAAEIAQRNLGENANHLFRLRQRLEQGLKKLPSITIFCKQEKRLPNTVMFGVGGMDGEMVVMELDRKGIAVSSGSACSSQDTEPSHVLLAMRVDREVARSAVRVSLGSTSTETEVDQFLVVLQNLVSGAHQKASGY
ncbi:MAG: cysteine desulfurase [Methylococcus sp.]|nr:MAG: cysteine desulfurase [Methylococcus sp.]